MKPQHKPLNLHSPLWLESIADAAARRQSWEARFDRLTNRWLLAIGIAVALAFLL